MEGVTGGKGRGTFLILSTININFLKHDIVSSVHRIRNYDFPFFYIVKCVFLFITDSAFVSYLNLFSTSRS